MKAIKISAASRRKKLNVPFCESFAFCMINDGNIRTSSDNNPCHVFLCDIAACVVINVKSSISI